MDYSLKNKVNMIQETNNSAEQIWVAPKLTIETVINTEAGSWSTSHNDGSSCYIS